MRFLIYLVCLICIAAWCSTADARGRSAGVCSACASGACTPAATPEKFWPFTPAKPPVVVAPVAPAVCTPAACSLAACSPAATDNGSATARRKPLRHLLKAVVGHSRRVARRAARNGG